MAPKKKIARKKQLSLLEWTPPVSSAATIWQTVDEAVRREVVELLAAMACATVRRRRVGTRKEPGDEP